MADPLTIAKRFAATESGTTPPGQRPAQVPGSPTPAPAADTGPTELAPLPPTPQQFAAQQALTEEDLAKIKNAKVRKAARELRDGKIPKIKSKGDKFFAEIEEMFGLSEPLLEEDGDEQPRA